VDHTIVYLDLCDSRFLCVMNELTQASDERRILGSLLHAGDTFVDIGANHGSYALIASRVIGSGGLVIAFEPQARLAGLLSQSLAANGASRFAVHAAACTEKEGSVEFFLPEGLSGSAGLFAGFSGRGKHQRTVVRTTTLDLSLANETITGNLFFKIDVEGSEFQAILGARNTILRYRPPILFEINPGSAEAAGHSVSELLDLLSQLGYQKFSELNEYPVTKEKSAVDVHRQRNLLALPDALPIQT
jgi:FkbM family methyltransferase